MLSGTHETKKITSEMIWRVLNMTKEEIAKAVGCGVATVYRVVKTRKNI